MEEAEAGESAWWPEPGQLQRGGEKEPQSGVRQGLQGRWAGQLGQGNGFSVFSWNPLAYNDSFSDSDTVMTSRGAK